MHTQSAVAPVSLAGPQPAVTSAVNESGQSTRGIVIYFGSCARSFHVC